MEGRMVTEGRTERQVVEELSPEEQQLLKRILQIERAKLHLSAFDATDDIITAVEEIVP